LLARFDELIAIHHPKLAAMLNPPIRAEDVDLTWGAEVGHPLPQGYLDLLTWHDGCGGAAFAQFVPRMGRLASLNDAIECWQDLRDSFDWSGEYEERFPLSDEGRQYAVRFEDGVVVGPWPGGPIPIFDSIPAMLATVYDAYEAGLLAGDAEGFLEILDDDHFLRVHQAHNTLGRWMY
jgi:cell wall assembly regulator SMI1